MHYYTQTGEPRHWMPNASKPGMMRPTTTRDAKKEGLVPSVTTIMSILDKPALVSWKIDQHLKVAFNTDHTEGFSCFEDYLSWVKNKTQEELDIAPKVGTDVHDSLEKYFLGETPENHIEICYAVEDVLIKNDVPVGQMSPEKRFASPMGYAGMCDLSHPSWVIDYKTKQTKEQFSKVKVYPEHYRQLGAYREGLGYHLARCANIIICLETNEVEFIEHDEDLLIKGWHDFMDCLRLWKRNNFDSSFN